MITARTCIGDVPVDTGVTNVQSLLGVTSALLR